MDLANYLGEERATFWHDDPAAELIFAHQPTLIFDFLPSWQADKLARDLAEKGRSYQWRLSWELLLASYLPARLIKTILQEEGLKGQAQAKPARSLAYKLKSYPLKLRGLKSFAEAQVALGGLDLTALRPDYSLKAYPGAYACGEALDVVGFCGGYNLHFAWASGYRAGQAAMADLVRPIAL